MLSHLCLNPPHFDRNIKTELPFFNIFLSMLSNRFGQHFFSKETVNEHLKSIIRDYHTLLISEQSLLKLDEMVDHSI